MKAEQPSEHLRREWLDEGRIVVYVVTSNARAVIEAWGDMVAATKTNWPPGKPYLALYDVYHPGLAFTPVVRQQASRIAAIRPEMAGRAAILTQRSVGGYALRLFWRTNLVPSARALESAVFFDRKKAIEWLVEAMQPHVR